MSEKDHRTKEKELELSYLILDLLSKNPELQGTDFAELIREAVMNIQKRYHA